jgi:shikimate kinase
MGAGKSSVRTGARQAPGVAAIDVDDLIEQREHDTVSALFAKRGEPYFRAAERAVLVEQTAAPSRSSSPPGGGTFIGPSESRDD